MINAVLRGEGGKSQTNSRIKMKQTDQGCVEVGDKQCFPV
jgi:hypothetical protein